MNTYVIGDVHGCYKTLDKLLTKIALNKNDKVIFTGDLVARGKGSLQVLDLILKNKNQMNSVLGNHDLHLLYLYHSKQKDTQNTHQLKEILCAKNSEEIFNYLTNRPLLITEKNTVISHAGIYPSWNIKKAQILAKEMEQKLNKEFFQNFSIMYGNMPNTWSDDLQGEQRYRFILNAFTRMRYVFYNKLGSNVKLDFSQNCNPKKLPQNSYLIPWFATNNSQIHKNIDLAHRVVFGHWSSLDCRCEFKDKIYNNYYALDSSCAWGDKLTALRIDKENNTTIISIKNIE
jgi:bis(5'-nucleosyl)-tetraphosphatase (symmetrical)